MKLLEKSAFASCVMAASMMLVVPATFAKPRLETGPDAEVTHDGLHRVDKTVMSLAWVKPDIDLAPYSKIMLVGTGISFKPVDDNGERWWPGRSNSQTEFPIDEEAQERVRTELREAFTAEFAKSERYQIVTEPGPGVLALVGAVIDVVSRVPPVDQCVGRCDVYLTNVGEATLVLELRDSVTNEVLARAADRRAAEAAFPIDANSVTVWPEVRRLAQTWGRIIRSRLDEFNTVDDF